MMEGYIRALKDLILPAPNLKHYHLLINELKLREFRPIIERDNNRLADGIYLKEELGFGKSDDDYCSLLEMLIALAGRFDGNAGFDIDEVYNNFWIMIKNIGLDRYDDRNWSRNEVWEILYVFENRAYGFDGKGGLFPLKHPEKDQRKVELWVQMQAWEIENYGV